MATEADVSHIVESLLKVISDGLKAGKSVFLDKFGQFRLSLSSKGAKTMKEFNTDMIRDIRILFHPCKELKPAKNVLSFEQKVTVAEQKASLKAKIQAGSTGTGSGSGSGGDTKPTDPTNPTDPAKPDTGEGF